MRAFPFGDAISGRKAFVFVAFVTLFGMLSAPISAEVPTFGDPASPFRVGVSESPPFIIVRSDGSYRGIAIELWERIASLADITYTISLYPREQLLDAVKNGAVDIAVGNLTINSDNEASVDFTHAFFHTNLAIATVASGDATLLSAFEKVFSKVVIETVLVVVLVVLALAFLIWILERRNNPDIFGKGKYPDFISGVLWVLMLGTALEGDLYKMRRNTSRFLGFLLLLVGTTIVASYIALITSALTVNSLTTVVKHPDDLSHVRVLVETGSDGAAYLEHRNIRFSEVGQMSDALLELGNGRADAVVGDAAQVKYLLRKENLHNVTVLAAFLKPESLAFALPPGSPHREKIDETLLRAIEDPLWNDILIHYLGKGWF